MCREQPVRITEILRGGADRDPPAALQVKVTTGIPVLPILVSLIAVVLQRDTQLRPAQIEDIPNTAKRVEHLELAHRLWKPHLHHQQLEPALRG